MSEFPTLENFFAAYFHQDWMVDHETPDAVVDDYLGAESEATVSQLRSELGELLAQGLEEDALAAQLRSFGCEYDPTRDGRSVRDWLQSIQVRIAG